MSPGGALLSSSRYFQLLLQRLISFSLPYFVHVLEAFFCNPVHYRQNLWNQLKMLKGGENILTSKCSYYYAVTQFSYAIVLNYWMQEVYITLVRLTEFLPTDSFEWNIYTKEQMDISVVSIYQMIFSNPCVFIFENFFLCYTWNISVRVTFECLQTVGERDCSVADDECYQHNI